MTEQEIQIAVAEVDGWIYRGNKTLKNPDVPLWSKQDGLYDSVLPDYTGSLDAIVPVIQKVCFKSEFSALEFQSFMSEQSNALPICRVCQTPTEPDNLTHLKIYVSGSEGVDVCITCRQVLTEVLRGMMRTCISGKKQGYMAAKQVSSAFAGDVANKKDK